MNSTADGWAGRAVRWWVCLYTRGLPADIRDRRRSEIQSDLWEQQCDGDRAGESNREMAWVAVHRLVRGMPADLVWRAGTGDTLAQSLGFWFALSAIIGLWLAFLSPGVPDLDAPTPALAAFYAGKGISHRHRARPDLDQRRDLHLVRPTTLPLRGKQRGRTASTPGTCPRQRDLSGGYFMPGVRPYRDCILLRRGRTRPLSYAATLSGGWFRLSCRHVRRDYGVPGCYHGRHVPDQVRIEADRVGQLHPGPPLPHGSHWVLTCIPLAPGIVPCMDRGHERHHMQRILGYPVEAAAS